MPDHDLSILLLARSLEMGGAERQLVELAKLLRGRGCAVRVAIFYRRGPLVEELEAHEIEILDLRKSNRWDLVGFLVRSARALRPTRPDVLYSFLGGANIVAAALWLLVPGLRVVWSVRASNMDLRQYDWTHSVSYAVERRLSGIPDKIIANSHAGREFAVANGFPEDKIEVVPNGIDTHRFRPEPRLRTAQRRAWGLPKDALAVGILARLDPMKGHFDFLRAAALVAANRADVRFLCIGEGVERPRLEALARQLGIDHCVSFSGESSDPVAALNGLDLCCSASTFGEGFSNAIAEAMACGKTCAVTDVGDSARIVGELGAVVPAGDFDALAGAMLRELDLRSPSRSAAARRRIVDRFSLAAMADRTLAILERVASHRQLRAAAESRS